MNNERPAMGEVLPWKGKISTSGPLLLRRLGTPQSTSLIMAMHVQYYANIFITLVTTNDGDRLYKVCIKIRDGHGSLHAGLSKVISPTIGAAHSRPPPPLITGHALLFPSSLWELSVLAGAWISLLCLLWQPPTQGLCCRNPCPASSSEWVAAGGEKSVHLPELEDCVKRKERAADAGWWVGEPAGGGRDCTAPLAPH